VLGTLQETEVVVTVTLRQAAADGVVLLDLAAADGDALPPWQPGAHIDLELAPGLVRQYSLCGTPSERGVWRVGVLREQQGRGGSCLVHKLRAGAEVLARGPRNHFALVPAARYLFIAGGIGVTPIVPMIEQAERDGADWRLLYGGRTRASMAFLDDLERAGGERVVAWPQDTHGLLDLAVALAEPRDDTLVYACGPEPLLDAVEALMARWPAGALHVERFTPKTVDAPAALESFEVVLERSGLTLTVPAGKSILDVVAGAGVDAPSSCGEGTCGTCETVVLGGEPEHRDSLLSPAEQEANETMMICVSRSRGPRLSLDL
jgi:ferredoxin-NADP reductase